MKQIIYVEVNTIRLNAAAITKQIARVFLNCVKA